MTLGITYVSTTVELVSWRIINNKTEDYIVPVWCGLCKIYVVKLCAILVEMKKNDIKL